MALIAGSALLFVGVLVLRDGVLASSDSLAFRRHWGGFGGEFSGWQMSRPLATCIGGAILLAIGASLAVLPVVALNGSRGEREQTVAQPSEAGARPSKPLTAEKPD